MTDFTEDTMDVSLQGGLKGRFAGEFCVLQSSIEALAAYLETKTDPQVHQLALKMLREMELRVIWLERLSDNAADLALGSALHNTSVQSVVDMKTWLQEFCEKMQYELDRHHLALQLICEHETEEESTLMQGQLSLMDGLLVNLVTNAASVAGCSCVHLKADASGLRYWDDGPGLPMEARLLLSQGAVSQKVRDQGYTGLPLVRAYAAALGWETVIENGEGTSLLFRIPALVPQKQTLYNADGEAERRARLEEQRADFFRREFTAVFGLPKEE